MLINIETNWSLFSNWVFKKCLHMSNGTTGELEHFVLMEIISVIDGIILKHYYTWTHSTIHDIIIIYINIRIVENAYKILFQFSGSVTTEYTSFWKILWVVTLKKNWNNILYLFSNNYIICFVKKYFFSRRQIQRNHRTSETAKSRMRIFWNRVYDHSCRSDFSSLCRSLSKS